MIKFLVVVLFVTILFEVALGFAFQHLVEDVDFAGIVYLTQGWVMLC